MVTGSVLNGLRVLDFTRHMAGPICSSLLADYGANVIKVEATPSGDGSRTTGTVFYEGESGLFLMWNRGKRDIALDLRSPEAGEILNRLVSTADVLIENFRPGVIDKMGLGYESLRSRYPRLIHASISAFGAGSLSSFPGTDPVVQAMSGVMSVTGTPDGEPLLVGVPIADFAAGMVAAQGILLAVVARERTGEGQKVDISMLLSVLSMLSTRLVSYWGTGENPQRNGSAHSVVAPYQSFPTADGFVMAGVWDSGWREFCRAISQPDLSADTRFDNNTKRVARRQELNEILYPVFKSHTTAEWIRRLRADDVLCSPVNSFSDIIEHAAVRETGVMTSVEHPTIGSVKLVGPVISLSGTPGRIAGPPPLLGEHTREILAEAGYGTRDIDTLIESGVVVEGRR